jgi:hypothetical protein
VFLNLKLARTFRDLLKLSRALETLFSPHRTPSMSLQPSDWSDVRMRWMDALETDSVFCPDGPDSVGPTLFSNGCTTATVLRQSSSSTCSSLRKLIFRPTLLRALYPHPHSATISRNCLAQNLKKANSALEHASLRWKTRSSPWIRFKF